MFKIGNFLFRREIIHYTGWQNLCRDKSRTARSWQNLCREESQTARSWQNLYREEYRQRGAGRTSAGKNPDGAELAESLPRGIRTARSWQNLCRDKSRQRGAGRISAGRNPDGAGLAEPLPGRIRTARSWQNLCREESTWVRTDTGSVPTCGGESMWVADSKSPLGICPCIRERINVGIGRTANHSSGSVPTCGGKSMWGYSNISFILASGQLGRNARM